MQRLSPPNHAQQSHKTHLLILATHHKGIVLHYKGTGVRNNLSVYVVFGTGVLYKFLGVRLVRAWCSQ